MTAPLRPSSARSGRSTLFGVCSIAGAPDVVCEIEDMRVDKLTIKLSCVAEIGDGVTLSVPAIGLVEGKLLHKSADRYVVGQISMRPLQIARLESYLRAMSAPLTSGLEQRRHERIVPLNRLVHVEANNHRRYMARIIDVSRSGVAVTCMASMLVGAEVIIGSRKGKVVRVLEAGYAIVFDKQLAEPFDINTRL